MTVGMRIKRIREFRKLTQKELGIRCGFTESNADVRIRQYENNSKLPREETLRMIADALDVNYINFYDRGLGSAEEIMQMLFWLDEMCSINLFEFAEENDRQSEWLFSGKYNSWIYTSARSPIGICISGNTINDFLQEWATRQHELKDKEITREEYFEWKINWPQTCDNGEIAPSKKWRK